MVLQSLVLMAHTKKHEAILQTAETTSNSKDIKMDAKTVANCLFFPTTSIKDHL